MFSNEPKIPFYDIQRTNLCVHVCKGCVCKQVVTPQTADMKVRLNGIVLSTTYWMYTALL